jgi:phenylpropionate dioxygenase-like ring-hydroxylating dioxygenase large terminal subunit
MNQISERNRGADPAKEALSEPMMLGVEAYTSVAYLEAERDKVWRKCWLQAGRVEEIPAIGNFITFEVLDDSILIVRSAPDKISAFHNVCQHRGRQLVDTPAGQRHACGKTKLFTCGFHGWRWNIEGENVLVPEQKDWQGVLNPENTRLAPVKVDTWGGWIWINMDPDCVPLREYLEPCATMLDPFELQNMRFRWRRWAVFDCNWKVAIEAFNETYHVPQTHPEFMKFGVYTGWGRLHGIHSNLGYDAPKDLDENQARLRLGAGDDPRVSTAEMQLYTMEETNTTTTQTMVNAALRLADELPPGTPADQVLKHWLDSARKDDEARGVFWPVVDAQKTKEAGVAWTVFPNFRLGHAVNNGLCYNALPCGWDPNKCIFEVSVFELFPPGEEPKTEWIYTPGEDLESWGSVLPQDFSNMAAVQRGMKSLGFKGPRPNPKEERCVTALHHTLAEHTGLGAPKPLK